MNKTLLPIQIVFVVLGAAAGWLVAYGLQEGDDRRGKAVFASTSIGVLGVLVNKLLKGFLLRGLSAITFGLVAGSIGAYVVGTPQVFDQGDLVIIFLRWLGLFITVVYLFTVVTLRGQDEFNLATPYVRFVPHEVESPRVVLDTNGLIDGRVVEGGGTGFLNAALGLPRFAVADLQHVADPSDPVWQARGRRGSETWAELREIKGLDRRIREEEAKRDAVNAKLVLLDQSRRAHLLTTDNNLAKFAEFHGVPWLNLNPLAKVLRPGLVWGESGEGDLMKLGNEPDQTVGYPEDGSRVVVSPAREFLGQRVHVEVTSVLPSAGGKMVLARLGWGEE